MTAALASHVDTVDLPAEPGVSTRAVRAVLRMMAKISNDAGGFRYGLRGSKLAAVTDYSLSVVRRAQDAPPAGRAAGQAVGEQPCLAAVFLIYRRCRAGWRWRNR